MPKPTIDHLPLRELFTGAERMTRDLIDHIERGFLPKCGRLNEICQPSSEQSSEEEIGDITIRNHATQVLNSEEFTHEFYGNTHTYLVAIDQAVAKITGED